MSRRVLVPTVVAVALLVAACNGDGDSSGPSTSSSAPASTTSTTASDASCPGCPVYGESDTTITATVGERFVIELESNASTGYEWTATSSDEAIVREESSEYLQSDTGLRGAPGTQRYVFAADAAGSATLTLQYARGFEDGAAARQVVFTVTVA